jgi:hypothetical protein
MALLPGHDIKTAQQMGWGRKKNGELLTLAEGQCDVFVTTDQNLKYQQNLTGRQISMLVLSTNTLSVLRAKHKEVAAAIATIQPGQYIELSL